MFDTVIVEDVMHSDISNYKLFKPIQTDSNRFKPIQTDSNRFKPIQTDSNRFKPIQTDSKRFKTIQNDPKRSKTIQNDSKRQRFAANQTPPSLAGLFSFYSQPKSHGATSIVEFIERAMEHSRSGRFLYFLRPRAPGLPPAPIQLLHPASRFTAHVASLQHMCRFSVLRRVRRDHIMQLPVPLRLKDYLQQSQYYAETGGVVGY